MKTEFATSEDVNLVLDGIKEICRIEKQKPESDEFLIANINKSIKEKNIIVAKENGISVGFIQFTFSNKEPYGLDYGKRNRYCWIEWTYVLKDYRHRGIGTKLYQEVKEVCKREKVNEIMVDVFEVNNLARKFYDKRGFKSFIHILNAKI